MRLTITFAFLAGLFFGPAAAFDASSIARTTWNAFVTSCGQAITDPQGYLNGVPNPGPNGYPTVGTSPDGQAVAASVYRNEALEEVNLIGFPGGLVTFCYIWGVDETMMNPMAGLEQQLLENPNLINDPEFQRRMQSGGLVDFSAFTTELANAFKAHVGQQPGVTLVGGQIPIGHAEGLFGVLAGEQHDRNMEVIGIEITFGTTTVQAIAQVEGGSLGVGFMHMAGNE